MYLGPQHYIKASARTSAVVVAFLLILFLVKITTPNPPYPEFAPNEEGGGGNGIGLEVNLGSGPDGMGDDQQLEPLKVAASSRPTVQPDEEQEKLLTNEDEDSEKIKGSETPKKVEKPKVKEVKKPVVKVVKPVVKTVASEPVVETPKPIMDLKNVFNSNNTGGNEGTTGKPGDQGNPNGVAGSKLYTGDGSGSGGGSGGGSGTGTGTGIGSGRSFSLAGRSAEFLQKPEYNIKEEGVVVVEITVDRNGKVIDATPILKGTTTQNAYLWRVAKEAALKAKFNVDNKAATYQKGTIRYTFELN